MTPQRMSARALIRWGELDARRRRAARRPLARLSPWLVSGLAAVLFAAEIHRRLGGFGDAAAAGATPGGTLRLWLGVTLAVHVVVLFGSPYRLYWRADSALLARLPIPGGALFRAALARSLAAAGRVAVPCAAAALTFGPAAGWEAAARMVALVAAAAAGAGALGPAASLAAGAVVASDKTQAMLAQMGGEFSAPKTSWLGILPGVAAAAVVIAVVALAPWAAGVEPGSAREPAALAAALLVPLLAVGWALARADRVMTAALREVSALDQERLAHIDRSTASPLERGWFATVLRTPRARMVALKDAALARRRYPSPYFLGPVGVVALWLMAAFGGAGASPWASVVLIGLAAYSVLMARRLWDAPVEIPRLLATLPVSPGEARAAKRAASALRSITWVAAGGVPYALAQPEPLAAWLVTGAALAVSLFSVRR